MVSSLSGKIAYATALCAPAWPIPLITSSSGLLQVARTDFVREIAPAGTDTWIYDNSKGVSIIPWYGLEFDALAPPYIQHNSKAEDRLRRLFQCC